jgi:hypothetical protein
MIRNCINDTNKRYTKTKTIKTIQEALARPD